MMRIPLEAREAFGIAREAIGQNLEQRCATRRVLDLVCRVQRSLGGVSDTRSSRRRPFVRPPSHDAERGNQLDDSRAGCDAQARRTHVDGLIVSALIGLGALILAVLMTDFRPGAKGSKRSQQ